MFLIILNNPSSSIGGPPGVDVCPDTSDPLFLARPGFRLVVLRYTAVSFFSSSTAAWPSGTSSPESIIPRASYYEVTSGLLSMRIAARAASAGEALCSTSLVAHRPTSMRSLLPYHEFFFAFLLQRLRLLAFGVGEVPVGEVSVGEGALWHVERDLLELALPLAALVSAEDLEVVDYVEG